MHRKTTHEKASCFFHRISMVASQAERDGSDVEVEKYNDDYDDEEVPLVRCYSN